MGACGGKVKLKHNHPLTLGVSEKPEYVGGWKCDKCTEIFENKEPRYMCTIDNFDLCKSCNNQVWETPSYNNNIIILILLFFIQYINFTLTITRRNFQPRTTALGQRLKLLKFQWDWILPRIKITRQI